MMKELSAWSVAAVVPTMGGAFGGVIAGSGGRLYAEQYYKLAYGRPLGDQVNVGLGFSYASRRAQGYERQGAMAVNGGLLCRLAEHVRAGFHVFYPAGNWMPVVGTAGITYDASVHCSLSMELRKEGTAAPVAVGVLEYRPVKYFGCMLGVATRPQLHYAGFNCVKGRIRAGLTGSYHPQLGITPNMMIVWQQRAY
ncbi:hypothetical protein MKQ68_17360 [Chitinophaga horti]|uniref:Outer membrane protein beta-barrel domain-containing protein n=1 Tax=Chitinophaga horti TaxID=2920382 RepID=A0ABY6IWU9_9BACT|nr:hypothetical protein [Chitinophaga horti]UYQ91857.1 hypothetical protein MKQ68_17360 [Chitinophaga horti]